MLLRYEKPDGTSEEFPLTGKPISIGRSPDADIVIDDEKASRVHCGIRFLDGAYHLKDLKSKNGTYLNNKRVEVSELAEGDNIRVGSTVFFVETASAQGADTAVSEMEDEMAHGKGYSTILKEIVGTVEPGKASPSRVDKAPPAES